MSPGISEDEFTSAVESCGYPTPTHQQYRGFRNGVPGSEITSKREIAMFMAQIIHESDGLRAKKEYNPPSGAYDYNDNGIQFCGGGYIQLTWKANYQAASRALFNDDRLVRDPELVARNEDIAWSTAFWYWKTRVHNAPGVTAGKFWATTKAINPMECNGSGGGIARNRFMKYTKVLRAFGINEKADESGCYC